MRASRTQNGAITGTHLRQLGLTRDAIRARVHRGRLVYLFPQVYCVGDPELMPLARVTAAVLSLEPAAFLSHRSAAAVWELAPADPRIIDVTVVGRNPRPRVGVRLHRVHQLHRADIDTRSNLRITSPRPHPDRIRPAGHERGAPPRVWRGSCQAAAQ